MDRKDWFGQTPMIPVAAAAEPDEFDARCRQPGRRWQRANPAAKRPKALRAPFIADLADGFDNLCGYCALLDPTGGTVDHYLSVTARPDLAYEWSNFRFANQAMNASKKNADAQVLDPYEVGVGWFEVILPSLQLQLTSRVPPALRAKAEFTLERLGLRDGERVIRARRQWYALYQDGDLTLDGLRQCAPLIADAVSRATTAAVPRGARRARTAR